MKLRTLTTAEQDRLSDIKFGQNLIEKGPDGNPLWPVFTKHAQERTPEDLRWVLSLIEDEEDTK